VIEIPPFRLRHRVLLAAVVSALCTAPLGAQQAQGAQPQHQTGGNEGKRPIGWQVRYDGGAAHAGHGGGAAAGASAGADTVAFAQMTPGFHVTTGGAAAVLWHPDSSARGNFVVESSIFLFPTKGRDHEGYGLVLGGSDLGGAGQRYTYFLLRNDGRYLVKQRQGDKLTTLTDWTPTPAIKLQTGGDAMKNDLRVEAQAETVRFVVNGTVVTSLPRARVNPDGVFGLRINHGVNAHVVSVGRPKAR
jgi:opacity protein-like surface antigen